MTTSKNNGVWLKTPDAVTVLGVSRDTLRRRRLEGFFVEGTHYLKTSPGRSGWYLWNVDRVLEVLGNWRASQANGGKK